MDKLKSVTVKLAAELSQYQLIEGDDHSDNGYQQSDNGYQQSDNGYQQSDNRYQHSDHRIEEDIMWDYYHFPSIGDEREGNGRNKNKIEKREEEEEESEDDITGDEAEQWLLRDANHMQERYGTYVYSSFLDAIVITLLSSPWSDSYRPLGHPPKDPLIETPCRVIEIP